MNVHEQRLASPIFTNIDGEVLLVRKIGRGPQRVWDLPTLACREAERSVQTAQRVAREILEVSAVVQPELLGEASYTSLDTNKQLSVQRYQWFGAAIIGGRPGREHPPHYSEIDFMSTEALCRQLPQLSLNAQAFYRQLSDGELKLPLSEL